MLHASETSSQTLELKVLKALNVGVEDSQMGGTEFRMGTMQLLKKKMTHILIRMYFDP